MPARKIASEELSRILHAICHPQRIRIIAELAAGEKDVQEVEAMLGIPQSSVSQHLGALKNCRLLETRRDGRRIYYSLAQKWVADWLLKGLQLVDREDAAPQTVIAAIKEARDLWSSRKT